jgi:ABC-type antimicrobial peptide transport system permease subunit
MLEVLFFIATSVLLALLLMWGFFHFLVTMTGIDDTDRKPVMPWFLASALIGVVVVPAMNAAWRYFTVDPQTLSGQPIVNMISPVVGAVLFGLIGGLIGLNKALRVEKTSTPRDEISQIQFSEISQWMKNDK